MLHMEKVLIRTEMNMGFNTGGLIDIMCMFSNSISLVSQFFWEEFSRSKLGYEKVLIIYI